MIDQINEFWMKIALSITGMLSTALSGLLAWIFISHSKRLAKLEDHISQNGITRPQVEEMIKDTMNEVRYQHTEIMTAINRNEDKMIRNIEFGLKPLHDKIENVRNEMRMLYDRRVKDRE